METLLLAGLLLCAAAPPSVGDGDAPSVLEGGRSSARALVIALHGGSWVDPDPARLAGRCRDELSAAARSAGLRLLVPVAPRTEAPVDAQDGGAYQVPWLAPAGEAVVLALIEREVGQRRADPARICLAGHGAGATGALLLAARHASRIAGVAAWAGAPPPVWDRQRRVVGLVEDPVPALCDMPVFLWSARDDPYLDRDALGLLTHGLEAQRAARGPRAPGASPTGRRAAAADLLVVRDDTGGHGYGAGGPGAGLKFLKAQRRPQPP